MSESEIDPEADALQQRSVWIFWGSVEADPSLDVSHYQFNTPAELQAFLTGIMVAEGRDQWQQFDTLEEVQTFRQQVAVEIAADEEYIPADPEEDPEGGCHCGYNCDRMAFEPCPIEGWTDDEIEAWRNRGMPSVSEDKGAQDGKNPRTEGG